MLKVIDFTFPFLLLLCLVSSLRDSMWPSCQFHYCIVKKKKLHLILSDFCEWFSISIFFQAIYQTLLRMCKKNLHLTPSNVVSDFQFHFSKPFLRSCSEFIFVCVSCLDFLMQPTYFVHRLT